MAQFEFKLPDIGEGIVEGEIVKWLVKAGDDIVEDQPLVEVITDKATVTIPSPRRGKVVRTVGNVGDVAKVHGTLVVLELGGDAAAAPRARSCGSCGCRTCASGGCGSESTCRSKLLQKLPRLRFHAAHAAPAAHAQTQAQPVPAHAAAPAASNDHGANGPRGCRARPKNSRNSGDCEGWRARWASISLRWKGPVRLAA